MKIEIFDITLFGGIEIGGKYVAFLR